MADTSNPLETDQPAARFVVGIDLGTTNSAVAYVDTHAEPWQVSTFKVPQLVAPGVVEPRDTLPSCHYQRAEGEFAAEAFKLPWSSDDPDFTVGFLARDQGTAAPGRLIASAKSWLCHAGVDRLADLLPWHAAHDVDKLSPVEASAALSASHSRRLELCPSAPSAPAAGHRADVAGFVRRGGSGANRTRGRARRTAAGRADRRATSRILRLDLFAA